MTGVHVHTLRIAKVVPRTADAMSIVFALTDRQRPRFAYRPGQFLTLRIPSDRGAVARCYSLSSSPHTDSDLEITVKRTVDGYGSNWLCDHAVADGEIDVLEPSGTFTPAALDGHILLVAGGSGITPVLSILKSVLAEGEGTVTLLYANRDENSVMFAEALRELTGSYPKRLRVLHWLESVQGIPTVDALDGILAGRQVESAFVCGPRPFMQAVRGTASWRALPRDAVHIERFASLGGDPFEDATAATEPDSATETITALTVTLDGTEHRFDWPRTTTLLAFLESRGLPAPSSCTEGICAACECRIVDGRVEMANNQVLEDEDLAEGYVLACQSRPVTDAVTVTYD